MKLSSLLNRLHYYQSIILYYLSSNLNKIVRWHRSQLAMEKKNGPEGHGAHTEGPDGMSAPQVVTFNRTEVAIPQIERCAVLSIARNIGCVTRVPPWVPGERTDGRHR